MTSRRRPSPLPPARALPVALLAAVLAGCALIGPSPDAVPRLAEPATPPMVRITGFSAALACMDDLFARSGTPRRYLTAISVPDQTGKGVGGGTLSMLISAVSEMNRHSNAFQFVYLPVTFSGAIPNPETGRIDLGYLIAHIKVALGGRAGAIDLPDYLLVASVSELDRDVSETRTGAGIDLGTLALGLAGDRVVSVMTTDFNVADGRSFKIINGANSTNSVALVNRGAGADLDARLKTLGGYLTLSIDRAEGPQAALRALIQLSAIETLGRLAGVPYQQCLIERRTPSGALTRTGVPAPAQTPTQTPAPRSAPPAAAPAPPALRLTSPSVHYRVGERLSLQVQAGRALDLRCWYQNARGQVWQVLPTDFKPRTRAGAGERLTIPGTPRYDLVFDTPGTERALCLGLPPGAVPALPARVSRTDLSPLAAGSLTEVEAAVQTALPAGADLARAALEVQVQ